MKNIFLLLLLVTGMVKAQIVNIPDANFKAYLLSANTTVDYPYARDQFNNLMVIDANSDGEIQNAEAQAVYSLVVQSNDLIQSIEGLFSFTNLRGVTIQSISQLSAIDLSGLPTLTGVGIENNNNLLSVNLGGLSNLITLHCRYNFSLSTINLSGLHNLVTFRGWSNRFTSLDLSDLDSLNYIDCVGNQLTTLDVIGLSQLTYLDFSDNLPLTSVNLIGLPLLTDAEGSFNIISMVNLTDVTIIDCPLFSNLVIASPDLVNLTCNSTGINNISVESNQITTANLTGCGSLLILSFTDSPQLNIIDLSGCTALKAITINASSFPTLDLSDCQSLESVFLRNSQLTELDVTMAPNLVTLDLQNSSQLRRVFMKNGSIENTMVFTGLNSLEFVCTDDAQIDVVHTVLSSAGFDYVVVNSYCSFVPGGNYNTITGNIKYDADNNGCDAADVTFPHTRVNLNDGALDAASFTNNSGNYTFYTQAGSFDITPSIENPTWFIFSPITATIPFADNNNNMVTQDFCITANGVHPDIEVVIAPVVKARPGFTAVYDIVYRNKGNQTLSGNITFTYNDSVLDFTGAAPNPDTQNTGLLNWNYSNLQPFEDRHIQIVLDVNTPVDTPSVHVGDILNFEATITPVIDDEIPTDNLFMFNQTVVGSFDPNDITCIEGDVVASTEIGNYLHYAINFENTGTFPAENIVVKTEVDPLKFNINSLQLMNTSDAVDARITGNKVEFIFENIQLPIGGHGHILLKIKTNNTLVTGDAVAKRADIFFDYNAPIDTGFANTVFQTLSISDFDIDSSVVVAPNPASNEVTFKADNNIKSIQLYDVHGRIISTSLVDELESKLNISNHAKGIYFVKIITEKGINVQKLLKD